MGISKASRADDPHASEVLKMAEHVSGFVFFLSIVSFCLLLTAVGRFITVVNAVGRLNKRLLTHLVKNFL